jgi:hypothetical protein
MVLFAGGAYERAMLNSASNIAKFTSSWLNVWLNQGMDAASVRLCAP